MKEITAFTTLRIFLNCAALLGSMFLTLNAQNRADWMRGALGLMWHPGGYDIQLIEDNPGWMDIEPFLKQVDNLDKVDFIQLNLTDAGSASDHHVAPHSRLEEMMGNQLICPRAASGVDYLDEWLDACKARGLRTQVYVNTGTVVYGDTAIGRRWKDYCDNDSAITSFLNSQSYHYDSSALHANRQYMFAYAEFILKEYSERYGNKIDAWVFDASQVLEDNGDVIDLEPNANEQRLYKAFADAARAGNSNAAVAFNHGSGFLTNPFNVASLYGDYTFGHPAGGLGNPTGSSALYDRNFGYIERMAETYGSVYTLNTATYDDHYVGHYFPKMSTTRWNLGNIAALSDSDFLRWNQEGVGSGGSIVWGTPLKHPFADRPTRAPDLEISDWAYAQLKYMNDRLQEFSENSLAQLLAQLFDTSKEYHIENPTWGLRLAATGNGQDPYTVPISDDGVDTRWKFISRGDGNLHIERAAGGAVPRLRTDNTSKPDMHSNSFSGAWTYYEITSSSQIDGTYYLTLPDGPSSYQRLGILSNGSIDFGTTNNRGNNPSLRIVEAD